MHVRSVVEFPIWLLISLLCILSTVYFNANTKQKKNTHNIFFSWWSCFQWWWCCYDALLCIPIRSDASLCILLSLDVQHYVCLTVNVNFFLFLHYLFIFPFIFLFIFPFKIRNSIVILISVQTNRSIEINGFSPNASISGKDRMISCKFRTI